MSGGAIEVVATGALLEHCIFHDNQSVWFGGAINSGEAGLQVRHCLFLDNTSLEGGAIGVYSTEISLEFCTFAGNSSTDGGALCAMSIWESHISNCTFWGNGAAQGAAISIQDNPGFPMPITTTIVAANNEGEGLYWDGTGTIDLSNVDIWGNTGGDWVGEIADQADVMNNIALDPLFCGVDENPLDFTLMDGSPCLAENNPDGVLIGAHGLGCPITQVGMGDGPVSAQAISLGNHPNPFNPLTTFSFRQDMPGPVRLTVFDMSGRQIVRLVDREYGAGRHSITWNGVDHLGRALPSGVYLAILEAGGTSAARKVSLVR